MPRHIGTTVSWSAGEDKKLFDLILKRKFVRGCIPNIWREVATHFEGRTHDACKQRFHILNRRAEGKVPPPRAPRNGEANARRTHKEIAAAVRQQPQIPPAPLYVPLKVAVAIILGEPAAGRSHLDKIRRGEVAPPPLMDGQPSRFLHKGVTLAQGVGEA